jgi:conjugative relaxase-like TrwC/TraI family protein
MLSMERISSVSATVDYFEEDDYYLTEEDEPDRVTEFDDELENAASTAQASDDAMAGPRDASSSQTRGRRTKPQPETQRPATGPLSAPSPGSKPAPTRVSREDDPAERSAGEWYGRGAHALGLQGRVQRSQFRGVLRGQLPGGARIRSGRSGGSEHTPGWDLTFSAPKSVSIVAEVTQDKRIFEAHRTAVHEALQWVERHAVVYRKRTLTGRRQVNSQSLVAALFQHHSSRALDPDLHTHAVVANATQREDGRWVAVHSHALYLHKMAAGVVYRAALARELQRAGYAITRTARGLFELAGVPEKLLDYFAKRRAQIEKWLEKKKAHGAKAASKGARATREPKRKEPLAELRAQWLRASLQHHFDPRTLVEAAHSAGPRSPNTAFNAPEVTRDAVQAVADREAVFPHFQVVKEALERGLGAVDVASVEAELATLKAAKSIETVIAEAGQEWLTPRAHSQEARVLRVMKAGQGAVPAITTERAARKALSKLQAGESRPLNTDQATTAVFLLSTKDRIVGVIGRPGAGKTTMLKRTREIGVSKGYLWIGMAPNAEAARTLGHETGMPVSTLHKHMARVRSDLARMTQANRLSQMLIRRQYATQVWVVDEASQMGNTIMTTLTFAADRLGARLILVGDPKGQLPSIQAGPPMRLMIDNGMRHARLDEIIRQKKYPVHKQAIKALADDQVPRALQLLSGDIRQYDDPEKRLAALLSAYRSLSFEDAQKTLILTTRNQDKTLLTRAIRNVLRARGRLSGEKPLAQLKRVFGSPMDRKMADLYEAPLRKETIHNPSAPPGEPPEVIEKRAETFVYFSADAPEIGVTRGEYLKVNSVNRDNNTVSLYREGPKTESFIWDPREVPGRTRRVELFHLEEEATVAPGEVIRWTKNDADLRLNNGQPLKVITVTRDTLTVETDDGRQIPLDRSARNAQHWDHAYVSTVFSGQGKTSKNALVNVDSEDRALLNRKSFLVAVSRHEAELAVFADDKQQLEKVLVAQRGDKTSAVESRKATRLTRALMLLESIGADWVQSALRLQRAPRSTGRQR